MRLNPFESQLERLARTLTEQFGVGVICQGDQAYTDGRTIVLPTLPEPLEGDLERMMVGFLDHEMAHVAFTDFKQVRRFNRKHPGFEAMLNVVEDALIEKLAMERWPGVRANLDALFRQVRDRVQQSLPLAGPFRRFCTAIYLELSHHQELLGLDAELRGYEDLLDRYPQVATTRDSARLSEQLLKRWLQRRPNPPATTTPSGPAGGPPSPSPSGNGIGEPIQSDASTVSSPQPPGNKPTDSTEDENDNGSDDREVNDQVPVAPDDAEEDNESPDAAPAAEDASQSPIPPPSSIPPQVGATEEELDADQIAALTEGARGSLIAEAVSESIAESVRAIDPTRQYRPFTRKHDRIDRVPTAGDHDVQQLMARNVDAVRRLRRGLANALRSAEKRWWHEEQTRGGLSPRTLYRLGMDQSSFRIFRTQATVQGRSTAVTIVLDASGSMSASKMDVARDAMRVLLDALDDLKIPTEAITFTTGDALDVTKAASESGLTPLDASQRFARFGNLEIGLIKRFEDPVKTALRRLPCVRGTGLTPLGEALEIGAARLIARNESRRILLTITDGQAGCESGGQVAQVHAQQVAKRINQAGIELIGVGIQDQSLCAIVADTIVVHDITTLPTQLCRLLGRTLKKGMHHVG